MLKVVHDESDPNATRGSASCSLLDEIVRDGARQMLAVYDYPAEHWIHLRTTNPIESTFATVRLRQRVTKGPGSRAAGVAMAFKLLQSAERRWRAVNAPHLVALVRAGHGSTRASLSNDPTTTNQDVIGKSRDATGCEMVDSR